MLPPLEFLLGANFFLVWFSKNLNNFSHSENFWKITNAKVNVLYFRIFTSSILGVISSLLYVFIVITFKIKNYRKQGDSSTNNFTIPGVIQSSRFWNNKAGLASFGNSSRFLTVMIVFRSIKVLETSLIVASFNFSSSMSLSSSDEWGSMTKVGMCP